jgi:broad specificity phosphatase PhoE
MNSNTFDPRLIVVRHAPVDEQYHGLCYGRSDVVLGPEGEAQSRHLIDDLASWKPAMIVHSGLQRTRFLAEGLAARLGCRAVCCAALQERDFGAWELQPWDVIHANHGDEMLRMISEPASFRPGGGESTFEMRDRVLQWFNALPEEGLTIAVTHGGPIAALLGTQRQLPVSEWVQLMPRYGQSVSIHKQSLGASSHG